MEKHITAPIAKETAKSLHAGDYVYVTGTIYTARDAAHKRMDEALDLLSLIHIQTLITCTGVEDFVNHRFSINKVFHVQNGQVTKENQED